MHQRNQLQFRAYRRMSHQSGRQNSGNHPIGKEKRLLKNDRVRDLWENIKHTNVHIIGVPEGEERDRKGQKTYLKK